VAITLPGPQQEQQTSIALPAPEGEKVGITLPFSPLQRYKAPGGAFSRGVERGVKQTKGLYGQFLHEVGDETGFASLVEMGDELVEEAFVEALRNPPDIAELSDVDWTSPSNIATFAAQTLGEQVFNIAIAGTGGGLGALAAKKIVSRRILKELAKRSAPVRGQFTRQQALARYTSRFGSGAGKGGIAGGFASFLPINTGEVIQEQVDAGLDPDIWSSLAIGAPMSALEMVGFGVAAHALFGKASKEAVATTLKQVLGRVGVKSFQSLAAEGTTEAVQEAMVIASQKLKDPTFSVTDAISSSEGLSRIAFAGLSGAVVGGVLGGAGGVARGTIDGMRIAKTRTTDLRRSIEGELSTEEADQDGNVNSLFGFNAAKQKAVAAVNATVKSVTSAVAARRNTELNPEEQETANVAAHQAARDTLTFLRDELKTAGLALGRLGTIRNDAKQTLNNILDTLGQAPKAEELSPKQNKTVRKTRDQIKQILDELKGKSTEQQLKLLPKALKLVDKQVAQLTQDPLQVPVARVRALVKAVERSLDRTFEKKVQEGESLRELIAKLQLAVGKQVSKRLTEPKPEQAGPVVTNEKDIFASIDAVAETGKRFAFAVGSRLSTVAQRIKDYVAKKGLVMQEDGNRVVISRKDDMNDDVEGDFTENVTEIDPNKVVVVRAVDKKGRVAHTEAVTRDDANAVHDVMVKAKDHAGPGGKVEVVKSHEEVKRLIDERNEELRRKPVTEMPVPRSQDRENLSREDTEVFVRIGTTNNDSRVMHAFIDVEGNIRREDGKPFRLFESLEAAVKGTQDKRTRSKLDGLTGIDYVEVTTPTGHKGYVIRGQLIQGRTRAAERQVRKALERGNRTKDPSMRIEATRSNGKKVRFHAGDLTTLGIILDEGSTQNVQRKVLSNPQVLFQNALGYISGQVELDQNGQEVRDENGKLVPLYKVKFDPATRPVDGNKVIYGNTKYKDARPDQARIIPTTKKGTYKGLSFIEWMLDQVAAGEIPPSAIRRQLWNYGLLSDEEIQQWNRDAKTTEEERTKTIMDGIALAWTTILGTQTKRLTVKPATAQPRIGQQELFQKEGDIALDEGGRQVQVGERDQLAKLRRWYRSVARKSRTPRCHTLTATASGTRRWGTHSTPHTKHQAGCKTLSGAGLKLRQHSTGC
jgi:hypothetical protein